ncbi:hypothetical protein KY335_02220, partial [Candidatus Woesearchaeota archaeon]|nr:hypothetical protein [Candidatus Woesearchaeota archaeon]
MRRLKKPAILASSAFVFLVTISLVSALIVGIMLGGLDTAEDAGIEKIRDLQESSSFFSKIVKANLDGFSKFLRFATSPFKMLGLDSFTGFAVLEPKEDKIKSNPNSVPMAPSTGTLDSSGGDDVEDAPETEDTNTVGETSAKFRGKKSSGGSGGNGYYYYPTEGDTTLGYFIKNLPEGMRLVLASDTSVDATTVGLSGTVDLLVGGGGTTGNYTGMITVQFTSNVSMEGTHTGTQKDDTGMSVLGNVTSG